MARGERTAEVLATAGRREVRQGESQGAMGEQERGTSSVSETTRTKCAVVDGQVQLCKALDSAVAPEANRGTGLVLLVLVGLKTDRERTCVVAKSGEHKKRGLVLRLCPWCGENIGAHMERRVVEAEEGQPA